jgi:transcriptional antiterminator NusG
MGLLDDIKGKEVKPVEPKVEERPPVGHFAVKLELSEEKISLTAGQSKDYPVLLTNTGTEDDMVAIKVDLLYSSEIPEPPEWTVKVLGVESKAWDVTYTKITEKEFMLISGGQREMTLSITCPKGARYGDRMNVVVNAISRGDPAAFDAKTLSFTARQAVLAVKSSIGHERAVADSIYARARAKEVGIFTILVPANLRGYVFVESMNPDRLEEVVRGVRRARGVVKGEGEQRGISFTDIDLYLTPKPVVSGIMEGDIVELVAGPFKGEKARVQKIDETKEEITVELFEAMVRIPVTVRGDHVRVLQKEREESKER